MHTDILILYSYTYTIHINDIINTRIHIFWVQIRHARQSAKAATTAQYHLYVRMRVPKSNILLVLLFCLSMFTGLRIHWYVYIYSLLNRL